QRGSVVVETALVFLPLILTLFSTLELTRGMWMYHTLTHAIKSGARFAVIHGQGCSDPSANCQVTVGDIATVIKQSGIGLDASQLRLTFSATGTSYSCATLASCTSDQTRWPPQDHNIAGLPITIEGAYAFQSVASVLWPGNVPSFNCLGKATEVIQF
ncbi:MAG: TadE/TadG family type IV pilus assembly protein, partial [Bryobacteraceae bacterium]